MACGKTLYFDCKIHENIDLVEANSAKTSVTDNKNVVPVQCLFQYLIKVYNNY